MSLIARMVQKADSLPNQFVEMRKRAPSVPYMSINTTDKGLDKSHAEACMPCYKCNEFRNSAKTLIQPNYLH